MKISVIIPVYNVERYLARCLDSVLAAAKNLSHDDAEIICVNDGSTDGSAEILERYRSTFNLQSSTFTVITKPNGGLGSARNAGLDAMTGDYVTFVDSDDWIPPHALATFAAVAEQSKARLVVSMSFAKDDGKSAVQPSTFNLQSSAWRLCATPSIAGKKVQYSACNKLYDGQLFKARRYPATIYEDFPVTTDVLCETGEYAAIDAPLYVYCTNAGVDSLVRSSFTERKLNDSIKVVRMTLDTARRQRDRFLARFAIRQAADGHSSTIGQVYKSRDSKLITQLLVAHTRLCEDYPEIRGKLSLKAAFRLWRMKHA